MANASHSGEMHGAGQNEEGSQDCRTYWFVWGWRAERPFFRSSCQRASASKVVGCQFPGTRKELW